MATQPQIKQLHVLFNNLRLTDERKSIIYDFTNGRTDSTKGLTVMEARDLIERLCQYLPCERQKGLIRRLAYRAGMIYGETVTDHLLNKVKIDVFLREKGTVKKDLDLQTYDELIRTHRQFEAICRNNAKAKLNKAADSAVKGLMDELNLSAIK